LATCTTTRLVNNGRLLERKVAVGDACRRGRGHWTASGHGSCSSSRRKFRRWICASRGRHSERYIIRCLEHRRPADRGRLYPLNHIRRRPRRGRNSFAQRSRLAFEIKSIFGRLMDPSQCCETCFIQRKRIT